MEPALRRKRDRFFSPPLQTAGDEAAIPAFPEAPAEGIYLAVLRPPAPGRPDQDDLPRIGLR